VIEALLFTSAFVCFLLGAAGVSSRVAWVPLGLAFWVLGELIALILLGR